MSSTLKYSTENTAVVTPGQFITTIGSSGTPAKIYPGAAQVFTVQCIADVAGSLAGKYFDCGIDENGAVLRIYFTVDAVGASPANPGYGRIAVVNVAAGATATTVATALELITEAAPEFTSTSSTDTVTVTNVTKGVRVAPLAGTSGFTVGVSTAGASTKLLVPSVSLTGNNARGTANTGTVYFGTSSTNDAQLEAIAAGKTVVIRAPDGGSLDLGQLYLDVATNSDGVLVSYPAVERFA